MLISSLIYNFNVVSEIAWFTISIQNLFPKLPGQLDVCLIRHRSDLCVANLPLRWHVSIVGKVDSVVIPKKNCDGVCFSVNPRVPLLRLALLVFVINLCCQLLVAFSQGVNQVPSSFEACARLFLSFNKAWLNSSCWKVWSFIIRGLQVNQACAAQGVITWLETLVIKTALVPKCQAKLIT